MPTLLERYLDGDHRGVWRKLSQPFSGNDDLRPLAEDVAAETMRRVARNVDLIAERLAKRGWNALGGRLRRRPEAEDDEMVRALESLTGARIPVSLAAFWKIVGGIDFVWDYRQNRRPPDLCGGIPLDEMDPLYVDPARHLRYRLEEWRDEPPDRTSGETWDLDLAPDYLHKADISGGPPYCVALPAPWADFRLENERHDLNFVDYLRLAVRWGGFPGLERHAQVAEAQGFVAALTERMELF